MPRKSSLSQTTPCTTISSLSGKPLFPQHAAQSFQGNAFRTYSSYADCEIIAIPQKYDFKPYAYGFQKDSPLLGPFNFYLKQLREKGSTKQILEKYESRPQVRGLKRLIKVFGI